MERKIPITVAEGDGIGPEIMSVTLNILREAGAPLEIHKVDIGEKVYLKGEKAGIEPTTWDIIRETKVFLKAPITTPQGKGFKSLNVTVRGTLGLYANIRPCVAYYPFIETKHPGMDVVIVRENEEDLYTGIEYRQSDDTVHALKIISRPACEKIIRYAFEYALNNKRKKVTCFTKDNILKLTDGLFHAVFDEIAKEYPTIENEHWIIDIGSAKLADTPTAFDVIVMPNLYGDILSDVAAQIAGSVGLAGSANIGEHGAMFEAIHGSAPRRAGQNLANPSGLILASVLMLVHLGQNKIATEIHNAWLKTIEEGIHTYDIYKEGISKEKVGTKEFGQAIIARLGKKPDSLKAVSYTNTDQKIKTQGNQSLEKEIKKEMIGVDIFIDWNKGLDELKNKLQFDSPFKLSMIGNRGVTVWPNTMPETSCIHQWRCRFVSKEREKAISHREIIELLQKLDEAKIDFVQIQTLCSFDKIPGFTLSQDEQ